MIIIGQDFTPGTLERYKTSLKHTQEFRNWKYKIYDIDITKIDHAFIKEFASDRLNQIRDIFLFSCYIGLAYVDVVKLSKSNIIIGIDGDKWIFTNWQKMVLQPEFRYSH